MLKFTGRAAIVTGAGGGLGREYALLLASRGCSVVVNDLEAGAADKVVDEIRASGGKALANHDSVEEGDKIVKQTLEAFGRNDILINNAGILRDRSLLKMADQDWDAIQQVHLRGSFMMTRAAWGHMRQREYGRIVMTGSTAGLYGNFGQTNYAAAKMGLVGLSNTLAVEGSKYNIHSNVIVPIAASRLTADLLPEQLLKRLAPFHVAPVVAYLCHENCTESGGIFEAAGGWVARYRLQRSRGKVFSEGEMTLENLERHWTELSSMDGGAHLESMGEHFGSVIQRLQEADDTSQEPTGSSGSNNPRENTNPFTHRTKPKL